MKYWFVLYVRSRSEKKLKEALDKDGLQCYLPLRVDYRKWSDRVKKVQVPMFPSYVFVFTNQSDLPSFYHYSEVVTAVKIGRELATVAEKEIALIRRFEASELLLEIGAEDLELGVEVEVVGGPLKGLKGELIEKSGQSRFVIRLEALDQIVKVQLPAYQIVKIY
jgi:transcription antitermination factor NusG